MNVAELERLLEQGQDWGNVEGEIARLELAAKWEYLTRHVIAAEKLVEAATKFMAAYHSGKNIHGHADNIDNVLKNINSDRECF